MSNVRHLMKRRATLQAGLAAGIAAATFPSAAASKRPQDTCLMGVWRSDRDRTVDMWRFKPGLDVSTRERIADMFGKLTLRFTDQGMFSEHEGRVTAATRYRIVASDFRSVVIEYQGEPPQPVVEQLFIEGESLYKHAGVGYNFEFFRRVVGA